MYRMHVRSVVRMQSNARVSGTERCEILRRVLVERRLLARRRRSRAPGRRPVADRR